MGVPAVPSDAVATMVANDGLLGAEMSGTGADGDAGSGVVVAMGSAVGLAERADRVGVVEPG